jgi:hypothetical protein
MGPSTLQVYFRMNEGGGSAVENTGSGSFNGSLTNAVFSTDVPG